MAIGNLNNYLFYGANATNAFANSQPPEQPLYVDNDDQYADWYLKKYGIKLDRSQVLPVNYSLQGNK